MGPATQCTYFFSFGAFSSVKRTSEMTRKKFWICAHVWGKKHANLDFGVNLHSACCTSRRTKRNGIGEQKELYNCKIVIVWCAFFYCRWGNLAAAVKAARMSVRFRTICLYYPYPDAGGHHQAAERSTELVQGKKTCGGSMRLHSWRMKAQDELAR